MGIVLQLVCRSGTYTIGAVDREVEVFFQEQQQRVPNETAKLLRLLDYTSRQGPPRNSEKCRPLENGLFEFKADSLRLIWFWDSGCVILCTHGFVKKRQKTPRAEIEHAKSIRASYEAAKRLGHVAVEE